MNVVSHRRALHTHARGFSLIELGIVIAVIAVLASVVIFGRGFIAAGRVSKAVEAANTVRKGASTYAGLFGGTLDPVNNGLQLLVARQLLPDLKGKPFWLVSGSDTDGFKIQRIGFGLIGNQNAVAIEYECPAVPQCQDLVASVLKDPNYVHSVPSPGLGTNCAGNSAQLINQARAILCFNL